MTEASSNRIVARYRLSVPAGLARQRAEALALEQSIEGCIIITILPRETMIFIRRVEPVTKQFIAEMVTTSSTDA